MSLNSQPVAMSKATRSQTGTALNSNAAQIQLQKSLMLKSGQGATGLSIN